MTRDDFAPFVDQLVVLAEIFNVSLSAAAQVLYFEALCDLEVADVARALAECSRSCTFMPKPAEIRARAVGDSELEVEMAWQTYKDLARRIGGYGSVSFDDPALATTLVAVFGGWEQACFADFTPEMWVAKRREFGRVYAMQRQRGGGRRQLPGFIERENTLRGYQAPAADAIDGETADQTRRQRLREQAAQIGSALS